MNDHTFVFAGNRFFVLKKMLEKGLDVVTIYAVKGSYLQRALDDLKLPYKFLPQKRQLVSELQALEFDYFISNGCPVILPISVLIKNNTKKFINIHPSPLPDLKGMDPVPGSLLYGRDSGATCHYMEDGIDTGPIISQVNIPMTDDLESGLLYQLSFWAEQQVFLEALNKRFKALKRQDNSTNNLYYTYNKEDLKIDFSQDEHNIMRKIKAFGTRSKGSYFIHNGNRIVVRDAEIANNPFLLSKTCDYANNQVIMNYEGKLLLRKQNSCLKLKEIEGNFEHITPNTIIE